MKVMKKVLLISISIIFMLCFAGCDSEEDQEAKETCIDIVTVASQISNRTFADYSKLPPKYKKSVSKEYYEDLCFAKNHCAEDESEYGVDYYDKTYLSEFEAKTQGDSVIVSYGYIYQLYSFFDSDLIAGSGSETELIPVQITFEEINDNYVVTDYYEKP